MLISLFPTNPCKQGEKSDLPARITKAGSKQTYYTIRFLMDRDRVQDAFRAYAYFRWVDDQLDCIRGTAEEKQEILNRQLTLLEACYNRESPSVASQEEQMLVDLVGNDVETDSGLQAYIRNMMKVMEFDVQRCGRRITQAELTQYTLWLSKAVTEYMFFFIGHRDPPPQSATRYHAVCGAHVVHMLRDMVGDIELGYVNIPAEVLGAGQITFSHYDDPSFRKWVAERVHLANQYFNAGRKYISQVKNFRCRLAGYAYLARFEWMLGAIERDRYILRPEYPERKSFRAGLWIAWKVLASFLNIPWKTSKSTEAVKFTDQYEE
jgi:phytoene/squalene synthetase